MRRILMFMLILLLAACDGGAPGGQAGTGGIINWNRDPQTVVFRADVVGGNQAGDFLARNNLPLCTVFGDNRVVWTNDLDNFNVQVLWDQVTDQQIRDFVSYLTVVQRIYTYDAQISQQPPSEIEPVYEQLALSVNDRDHVTDAFAGWEFDYFQQIVDTCKNISRSPVIYEPEGAWVTSRRNEYNPTRPSVLWESGAAGLSFAEIATSGEPRWITGQNVRILWNMILTSSPVIQFVEGESTFEVVLEVPGVHPNAPAAP